MDKIIKLSQGFKDFLTSLEIKGTYEEKIKKLIELNNPQKFKEWQEWLSTTIKTIQS